MFIQYGVKAKHLTNEVIAAQCPACEKSDCIDMHVLQRYFQLYWIPFWPLEKTGVSYCNHCKQTLKLAEMPYPLRNGFHIMQAKTRTPMWTTTGLWLIIVFLSSALVYGFIDNARNAKLILSPLPGDVYEVKIKENKYTLYKVDQVIGDSVILHVNRYHIDSDLDFDKIMDKDYSTSSFKLSKTQLAAMVESHAILDVDREESKN